MVLGNGKEDRDQGEHRVATSKGWAFSSTTRIPIRACGCRARRRSSGRSASRGAGPTRKRKTFLPDCDLSSSGAQDLRSSGRRYFLRGRFSNQAFGTSTLTNNFDPQAPERMGRPVELTGRSNAFDSAAAPAAGPSLEGGVQPALVSRLHRDGQPSRVATSDWSVVQHHGPVGSADFPGGGWVYAVSRPVTDVKSGRCFGQNQQPS